MKRVALIGGSFDPVHEGHAEIARTALKELNADEVWFIPSNSTPLKDRELTSVRHRLAMLKLITAKNPKFKISDVDLKRNGVSYSIDTMRILKEQYPDTEFFWLIGTDQAEQFDQWKDAKELSQLAQFVIVDRNGRFPEHNPWHFPVLDMKNMPVSSTDIRNGSRLNYLDPQVLQYILDHELYLYWWLKPRMSDHRFAHSSSVARLSRALAHQHGLDEHKAFLCGLFHDIAKDMEYSELKKWIAACTPQSLNEHHAIWHGYAGGEIVKRVFGLTDPVICNAISNHVKGTSYDPYAMIVFIADKLDPLRGYDSSAMVDACMRDLYNGFMMVKQENKAFLEKEKKKADDNGSSQTTRNK